ATIWAGERPREPLLKMDFQQIGVIGAGNIGIGVVTDLVLHGITAVVVDISDDILQCAQAEVLNNIRFIPLLPKTLPRITKDEAQQRMTVATDLNQRGACDFVMEHVTGDWAARK